VRLLLIFALLLYTFCDGDTTVKEWLKVDIDFLLVKYFSKGVVAIEGWANHTI